MADTTAKKASTSKKTTRTPAKKASTRKTPAKKTAAKNTAAKKTPEKKPAPRQASARTESPPRRRSAGGASRMAQAAREAVVDLTGRTPEGVTVLERTEDGWAVEIDVLELERIPRTTDVLATYRVRLDDDGELEGCRRVHRYLRGSAGDE
jgi:hypothetical protein